MNLLPQTLTGLKILMGLSFLIATYSTPALAFKRKDNRGT